MFLVFQIDAIPNLERFCGTVEVLLVKAIQLNDFGVACDDLDLVTFRRSAPLCCADLIAVQCEGLATAAGFPAETGFRQSASTRLLAKVKERILKGLPSLKSGNAQITTMCTYMAGWLRRSQQPQTVSQG